jgi:hypothetical protein
MIILAKTILVVFVLIVIGWLLDLIFQELKS